MRNSAGLRPWWALDSDVPGGASCSYGGDCLGDCSNPSTTGSSEQKRSIGMPIEVVFLTNSASGLRIMPGGSRNEMLTQKFCTSTRWTTGIVSWPNPLAHVSHFHCVPAGSRPKKISVITFDSGPPNLLALATMFERAGKRINRRIGVNFAVLSVVFDTTLPAKQHVPTESVVVYGASPQLVIFHFDNLRNTSRRDVKQRRQFPSRLRKKSVRGEIGGIFGDTKSSPATDLAFLGQLCVIYFFALFAKLLFPQPASTHLASVGEQYGEVTSHGFLPNFPTVCFIAVALSSHPYGRT